MLVLQRKLQEGFWIGDSIYVKVIGIGRNRVRIGIEAPGGARILRGELVSKNGKSPAPVASAPTSGPTEATAKL